MLTGLVSSRNCKSWLVVLLVVGLGATAFGQTERIWTDARGAQISGELEYITGNHVVFNSNGRQICILLSAISEKDRKYIHRITRNSKTSGFTDAQRKGAGRKAGGRKAGSTVRKKSLPKPQPRVWTNRSGQALRAKYVRVFNDNVVLLKTQGSETIPYWDLSPVDQQYVANILEAQGIEVPPTEAPEIIREAVTSFNSMRRNSTTTGGGITGGGITGGGISGGGIAGGGMAGGGIGGSRMGGGIGGSRMGGGMAGGGRVAGGRMSGGRMSGGRMAGGGIGRSRVGGGGIGGSRVAGAGIPGGGIAGGSPAGGRITGGGIAGAGGGVAGGGIGATGMNSGTPGGAPLTGGGISGGIGGGRTPGIAGRTSPLGGRGGINVGRSRMIGSSRATPGAAGGGSGFAGSDTPPEVAGQEAEMNRMTQDDGSTMGGAPMGGSPLGGSDSSADSLLNGSDNSGGTPNFTAQGSNTCSKCQGALPADIEPGDRCPHCDAFLAVAHVDASAGGGALGGWADMTSTQKAGLIAGIGVLALLISVVIKVAT